MLAKGRRFKFLKQKLSAWLEENIAWEENMCCVFWRKTEFLTQITKIIHMRTVIYAANEVKLIKRREDISSVQPLRYFQ